MGFLNVTLRDSDRPNERTGVDFTAELRLPPSDDKFLSVAELPQAIAPMQPAITSATAGIHLRFRTAVEQGGSLPAILGTIDWRLPEPNDRSGPVLDHLYIDVGDFAKQFVQPIAQNVKSITSPLRPVADAVYTHPGLSEVRRTFDNQDVRLVDILPRGSNLAAPRAPVQAQPARRLGTGLGR